MKYLVTGGSGFLGTELIRKLVSQGHSIRTIARNEGNLIKLKDQFPDVEIFFGDIANRFEVDQFMNCEFDGVFHLAAFKHVTLAETFPIECINTNITGSLNVIDSGSRPLCKFIIGISTDKAAQVKGIYGASKLIMESLFSQYEKVYPEIKYRIVRYGNILYSTGSVLCKWKELISQGNEITVTDLSATRFFWTVSQAVDLIFDCINQAENSAPFVPEMKAIRIEDLINAMEYKYSPIKTGIKFKLIGLQKGENLHEKILENGPYSNEVELYGFDEILNLI